MDKKTFAQLKRDLKVGTKIVQVRNDFWMGTINSDIREISIVQTNAVAFKTNKNGKIVNSWLWFPKTASDVIYIGDEFTFISEGKKISYKIIQKEG